MKKLALTALLATVFLPSFAQAQNPNIATLTAQIEGFLDNQKSMAVKNNCVLSMSGSVTAVPATNGAYTITLPRITYTDAKGIVSDIGTLKLNATPAANPYEWDLTLSLPTSISSRDASGAQVFETRIGSQQSEGVWNERLGHFTSVHATLGNLSFKDFVNQGSGTLQNLILISAMQERDENAYTGSADLTLNGFSYRSDRSGVSGSVPKITFTTNLADLASVAPMTKEAIKARPKSSYPDGFNIFAQLLGKPERVDGRIYGLDSLSAQLSQAMLTSAPTARQDYMAAILGVGAVAAMGTPDPADSSARYYDVQFAQNGSILLNGTDVNSLANSVQAKK